MNRRRFIQSLAAVFCLPAAPSLSFKAVSAAVPTAVAVPAHARSWAVYMSTLHGECTPQTLQNLLNIPAVDAKRYVTQLIADGALKPNPLLQRSVAELTKTNEGSFFDKVKKRLDKKAGAEVNKAETDLLESADKVDASELMDADVEVFEDPQNDVSDVDAGDVGLDGAGLKDKGLDDEVLDEISQTPDDTDVVLETASPNRG